MTLPNSTWLEIVTYRDFYDVPRLILAKDPHGVFWVLDSSFNDELDEYEASYRVYRCSSDSDEAHDIFEGMAKREIDLVPAGTLAVNMVRFDETRRKTLAWEAL